MEKEAAAMDMRLWVDNLDFIVIERAKVQLAELEVKLGFAKKIEETLEICKRLRTSYRERDDAAVLAETLEAVWEKKNGIVFGTQ